jgi:hypothetical protein
VLSVLEKKAIANVYRKDRYVLLAHTYLFWCAQQHERQSLVVKVRYGGDSSNY